MRAAHRLTQRITTRQASAIAPTAGQGVNPCPDAYAPARVLLVEQPEVGAFNPPKRLLMGPGPGNAHPRVHAAMALPQIGHMDGAFLQMAEEIKEMLRYAWQTKNPFTVPCSGTGSAAWEALCANLTSPGDKHLVLVNGYFGLRHCDMASRYGAEIIKLEKPWGEVFTQKKSAPVRRTQTRHDLGRARGDVDGRLPAHGPARRDRAQPRLSLGGGHGHKYWRPAVRLDEWGVDAAYAGGQKALSCPPGIAPLTFGDRALDEDGQAHGRRRQGQELVLDMNMIKQYLVVNDFGVPRVYHHTAPISMAYALREALGILTEEGLEGVLVAAPRRGGVLLERAREDRVGVPRRLGAPTADADNGEDPGRHRWWEGRHLSKGELQHRDRRRPRGAGGQGLAHRADGLQRAPRERGAGLCCFTRRARRPGGYYRAPGLLYPSRQHSRSSFHGRLISPYPGLSCP